MMDNSLDMNQVYVFFYEDMLKYNNGYGVFDIFEDLGFLDVFEFYLENVDCICNI